MPPTDYFLSKLPAGHATTLLTKSAATALLRADILVLPTFAFNGSTPEMRELCAAALWIHSPNYSATAVQQLPMAARNTLCRLMGIPSQPNGIAASTSSHWERSSRHQWRRRRTAVRSGRSRASTSGGRRRRSTAASTAGIRASRRRISRCRRSGS